MTTKNKAAQELGALGGKSKSEAKTLAARENGRKGGRPPKPQTYQHPSNGILLGISTTGKTYAAYRECRNNGLCCVTLTATIKDIESIIEAWWDDDHELSRFQSVNSQMEWIDLHTAQEEAPRSFILEAIKYVHTN